MIFFFFNDTATTEIYTLSLHDALPISRSSGGGRVRACTWPRSCRRCSWARAVPIWLGDAPISATGSSSATDRKSTRLNSSHDQISYAVFCLKKKNNRVPRRLHGPQRHL